MNKILIMAADAMMAAVGASTQHRQGDISIQPRVGVSFATLTNTDDSKMKANLAYGAEYEQFVADQFSLAGGILFTNQGTKYTDVSDATLNVYYFAVPITANYYVLPGLAVKAGVQPAYRVKTNMKMNGQKYDVDKIIDFLFNDSDVKMSKFDLSIPVGLSFEYNRVTLDARYNFGVTKLFTGIDDTTRNQVITITLGYKM